MMYLITVEETMQRLSLGGNLPITLVPIIADKDDPFGSELLESITASYLEFPVSNIYSQALNQMLSIMGIYREGYKETIELLIENDRVEPFLNSIMCQKVIPYEMLVKLMPYSTGKYASLFLQQRAFLTTELLDLFIDQYVNKIISSDEMYAAWVDRLGFSEVYQKANNNTQLSETSKQKMDQLLLMWRASN